MAPRDASLRQWLYRHKLWVILSLTLLIAGLVFLSLVVRPRPHPPTLTATPPSSTAAPPPPTLTRLPEQFSRARSVEEAVSGAYVAWSVPDKAIPPTREPLDPLAPGNQVLGLDCLTYLGSGSDQGIVGTWDNPNAINWGPYDNCLDALARRTVKLPDGRTVPQPVILTLPSTYSDVGARWYDTPGHGEPGTADNPIIRLHLPPWMQNETYRFTFQVPESGKFYQSLRYGGAFKQKIIQFIQAAGVRYNNHPQVSAIRIAVGFQGESQPVANCQPYWDVKAPKGADWLDCTRDTWANVIRAHQETVTCAEYVAFIKQVTEAAYVAFPDKPVAVMASVSACTDLSGSGLRRTLFGDFWPDKRIGVSVNSIDADKGDAADRPGNAWADWAKYAIGRTLSARGAPVIFEYDFSGGSYADMYWTELSGAANGGDFILHHSSSNGSYTPYVWEVIDDWVASDGRAWIVFRDREWPTYDFAPGYGTSGTIGDFSKHLSLLNPEGAPQVCEPKLWAAAQAANAAAVADHGQRLTPACPGTPMPTPAITPAPTASPGPDTLNRLFNRQARRLPDSGQMLIALTSGWPYNGGASPITVTVSYLDIGTDRFDIYIPASGSGSPRRQTITKQGSGLWKRFTWNQMGHLANTVDGEAFIKIVNDASGPEYLHEIFADAGGPPFATATLWPPEPTATPSATPSADADRDADGHAERHTERHAHRDAERHAERHAERRRRAPR